jgi:hypothetical protein
MSAATRGSGLASLLICRSSRLIAVASVSMSPQRSLCSGRVDQVRLEREVIEQVSQPTSAGGGFEGHRGAGRQNKNTKDGRQLGRVVGDVTVALDGTGVVDDGDL